MDQRTVANFAFHHGLGDVANLARLIPVYQAYGIDVEIETTPDKHFPLIAAGAKIVDSSQKSHGWWIPGDSISNTPGSSLGWCGNKPGSNMRHFGLDDKAPMNELWKLYKMVEVQLLSKIPQETWDRVSSVINHWPRPLVLWHNIGNTSQERKSFTPQQQTEFAYEMLDRFEGTLLILDWDRRATWTHHHRLKHLDPEFGPIDLMTLAALMYRSALMIGVDSGPLYYSSLTHVPVVGVYFESLHPSEYLVPWSRILSLTMGEKSRQLDASKRFEFQLVDTDGSMKEIAYWCQRMLDIKNRYLPEMYPRAADVQLEQIIHRKCRGVGGSGGLSNIYDRNHSFDILFQEMKKFRSRHIGIRGPDIVETGCIRSPEDWAGAGFSTALFGRYASLTGGSLTSFDTDRANVYFAQQWCRQFGDNVKISQDTGEAGIREYKGEIDVLYLDSLDSGSEGHQECNLREFKAAESKLHRGSLVLIDDTPTLYTGKGALTVKYALEHGWKILYGGYQVLLTRNPEVSNAS
jgi:hypothetical protein